MKRAKYCVRGLVFARHTREWFDFLGSPPLAFIVENNPCLFHKLQRPYLNRTFNTLQRLEALKQHYNFVVRHFSPELIAQIFRSEGKVLAELRPETGGLLELRLTFGKMQKEGDLTICLESCEPKKRIATLSFSVSKCEGNSREIFIGGLQGDKAANEQVVVSITRALYGLRPKALLFFVLQQLADCWGICRIQAVSDDLHIYRHFQSRRKVAASYNKFWIECGGLPAYDGTFDLPVVFRPRDISAIRVNKRQLYRRRYVMLEGIRAQIIAGISHNKNPSLAAVNTRETGFWGTGIPSVAMER